MMTMRCFARELFNIMGVSAGVRRFGSAALDLAYVAAGRFDGFWEHGLKSWDIAAGILLVREAGGFVSDFCVARSRFAKRRCGCRQTRLYMLNY